MLLPLENSHNALGARRFVTKQGVFKALAKSQFLELRINSLLTFYGRYRMLTEDFIVTEIDSGKITVSSCKTETNSDRQIFHIEVANRSNFKIEVGSIVRIGFPKKYEFIQGIVALLFPILFGLAGMLFAPHILEIFKIECTEKTKFLMTAAFFLTAALVMRILNRSSHTVIKPSITAVLP